MPAPSRTGIVLGLALSTLPTFVGCRDIPAPPDPSGSGAVTNTLGTGKNTSSGEVFDTLNSSGQLRTIAQDATSEVFGVSETKKNFTITDQIVTSDGSRVRANPSGYYGHGYIMGSPISSADVGWAIPTYELHINQGYFPDDTSYIGSDIHLSIDGKQKSIFDAFQAAERQSHQNYVFEYIEKNPLDPEVENSHLFLQRVYDVSDFLGKMDVDSMPKGIKAKEPWQGSSGTKTKVGRIVDVERYGAMGNFCVLEINMTGLSSAGGEKLVKLTVMDEDIAVWCEKAMALGRDVEIQVSEDVMETWQPSSMFVTGIQFKDTAPKATNAVTKSEYESIRDRLMADPVFMKGIRDQLP